MEEFMQQQSGQFLDNALDLSFSKRTFQRDLREISALFAIDIEYSKARDGYFISNEPDNESYFLQLAEYSDFLKTLNYAKEVSRYIAFERKEDKGSQYVATFLKAIHNRTRITFNYHKYTDSTVLLRKVEAYGLKEHRGRWYVVGRDVKDNAIKSFGLDRISLPTSTAERYDYPAYFSMEEYYKYAFGICRPTDQEPEEVILTFPALKGQYIKTYPLHHTQQLLSESDTELTVKLYLYITFDFIMELQSHRGEVRVVAPVSLTEKCK